MKASAWILPMTQTLSVAVSEFELVHLLPDKPTGYKIPKTPEYCEQVIVWEKKIIPLMDFARRFGFTHRELKSTDDYLVAIVAYRNETTEAVGYGALFLNATPYRLEVSDTQACNLPDSFKHWAYYAKSCFTTQDDVVAILRLNRLFLPGSDAIHRASTVTDAINRVSTDTIHRVSTDAMNRVLTKMENES